MPKRENHPDLEFLEPEAGVADVKVALFAEVFDLLGDDLYIIGAVCDVFAYFAFLPFLDTFGSKNKRKSV